MIHLLQQNQHLVLLLVLVVISNLTAADTRAEYSQAEGTDAKLEVKLILGQSAYMVNDEVRTMDVAPFVEDGRTLVPVRFVGEAFGAEAKSFPEEGSVEEVVLTRDGTVITLEIGSPAIAVVENAESRTVTSDAAPQIYEGRAFLPLRALAEIFGAKLDYGPRDAPTEWVSFMLTPAPGKTCDLTFQVYDQERVPLEGATVELNGYSGTTDNSGETVLVGVAAGEYEFTVSRDGYLRVTEPFRVESDEIIEVVMRQLAIYNDPDPNEAITVEVGQPFVIALESNPTTGFFWSEDHDPEMLELLDRYYVPDELAESLDGVGGTEYFVFEALQKGETEIHVIHKFFGDEDEDDMIESWHMFLTVQIK